MTYLVILCEGDSELFFVRDVLSHHLAGHGVAVHQVHFGKRVDHDIATAPGGIFRWSPVYKHIMASLRQYSSASSYVTTMMDSYAFPRDFPEYQKYLAITDPPARVEAVEAAMSRLVASPRFIPNVQLHEFEALIFSKLDELLPELEGHDAADNVRALAADVKGLTPEEIDHTPEGAPSKRIARFIRGYDKTRMGPQILKRIGWEHLRDSCPHFAAWLAKLEALGQAGPAALDELR